MIDASIQNFDAEVVEASMTTPVLVDFWAPWCGPCTSLGPVLEKLEVAYAGRFKLVKINADKEQQICSAFGVRSLPTCALMVNGQPVDGFTGALPEGKVREFLDKHLLPAPDAPAELELTEETPLVPGSADAIAVLREAVALAPDNDAARYDLLRSLRDRFHKVAARSCPFANIPVKERGKWGQGITPAEMKKCHWLKPKLVCQVKFAEWTRDGRLRQPVFLGLRADKRAADVVRETPV